MLIVVCAFAAELFSVSIDTDRRVRFNQAVDAYSRGTTDRAIREFDALLQEDPNDVASLYYLGLCYLDTQAYAEATEAFQKVLAINPELIEASLDSAIAQLGQNERRTNEAARQSLIDFLAKETGDEEARGLASFFLGVAEYRLANYESAIEALGEAAKLDQTGKYAKDILFYRGLSLAQSGQPEQAEAELTKLHELLAQQSAEVLEMTPETRERMMDQTENLIRQVQARRPISLAKNYDFRIKLDLGFNYDTNVVLLGEDTSLPVNVSGDDDFRFGLSSDIRYLQRVTDKFSFGLGGSTFNSWHPSLDEFNVQTYAGRAFLNYAVTDDFLLGLQYDYDHNIVNSDIGNLAGTFLKKGWDGFLSRNRITPSLRLTELYHPDDTPLTWTTVFYRYEDRDYHETLRYLRLDRTGRYHGIGLLQDWNILQPRWQEDDDRYLHTRFGYLLESAATNGDEFDFTGHGVSAGVHVPLPWQLNFGFTGQWTWEGYRQPNFFDFQRRKRKDFVQRYTWSLGREFELAEHVVMNIRGQIALTLDDSNVLDRGKQATYSYDRTIYGLTIGFVFR